uniref:Uncharacterized protein n=1 Tax=Plectus sambesii TaxID=2011161 RepID=A0A914VGT2_9BILA
SKQATHDNLNTFVGLTYNNLSNECLFLWKLCTRGSLQDIVANEDLMLDMDFKASFINDIIKVSTSDTIRGILAVLQLFHWIAASD